MDQERLDAMGGYVLAMIESYPGINTMNIANGLYHTDRYFSETEISTYASEIICWATKRGLIRVESRKDEVRYWPKKKVAECAAAGDLSVQIIGAFICAIYAIALWRL